MSTLLVIARREFRSYFDSPLAYVVICLSFVGVGLFFFSDFWDQGRVSMDSLFRYLSIGLSVIVVPVVTMRLMAEEKRSGTLEMLITLPVKDSDVILGKFLGAFGLVMTVVVASLAYPIMMFKFPWSLGPLDMGPVLSGYLGITLLVAASVAVGLLISSFTESQAISFFVTLFVLGVPWLVFLFMDKLFTWAAPVVHHVSFASRLTGFQRGLIDTRDVIFFLSITILALMVSFRALERRKWA